MAEQHPTQETLVDLALGDVASQEPLVRHLSTCSGCRAEYDAIAAAADQTLLASPRVEPPPGFDRTVLDAMGIGDDASSSRSWRRSLPRPWWMAAAAAVGVLAGVGATVAVTQSDEATQPDGTAQQTVLAEGTALRTPEGEQVGSIARSFAGGRPVIVVSVTDGPVGVHYTCRLQLSGGGERAVGDWVLESAEGATWVVPAPRDGVEAVELVTDTGSVWSSAPL